MTGRIKKKENVNKGNRPTKRQRDCAGLTLGPRRGGPASSPNRAIPRGLFSGRAPLFFSTLETRCIQESNFVSVALTSKCKRWDITKDGNVRDTGCAGLADEVRVVSLYIDAVH